MKHKHILAVGLAGMALLVVTGCQSVSSSHSQAIGAPRFPASDPTQVQILRAEPTRAHVRVGEVRAEPASESTDASKIEDALRKEAAKLGADAAVVVSDKTQLIGEEVAGGVLDRSLIPIEGRVVVAVAIKYR